MNYLEYAIEVTNERVGPKNIAVTYKTCADLRAAVKEAVEHLGEGQIRANWRGGSPGSDYCVMMAVTDRGNQFSVVGFAVESIANWSADELWCDEISDEDTLWNHAGCCMRDRDANKIIPFSNVEDRYKKMMTICDDEPDEDLDSFLGEFSSNSEEGQS